MTKSILVVGATGVVGQGVVSALIAAGHHVICAGRDEAKLSELAARYSQKGRVSLVVGSVATTVQAKSLADAVLRDKKPDAIVTAVSGARMRTVPVFDLTLEQLDTVLRDNVTSHLEAAKALIPIVGDGGLYLGIGGGMADLVFPGGAAMSMAQAAQRALFRYLAEEGKARPVEIRELLLYSMIAPGDGTTSDPRWISAEEVGRHVLAIVADPATFEGPILALKSKKQVGSPERRQI